MEIAGFDWDDSNWPKCGKHGVSQGKIEQMLSNQPLVYPDPFESEERSRAIGPTMSGRYVYCVFTIRGELIRPISARYIHQKEIDIYEQERP